MLEKIKDQYRHANMGSCCDQKCKLLIDSRHVVLKGELLGDRSLKMCDCVVFLDSGQIILVEMKRKKISIGDVKEQFFNAGVKSLEIARDAGADYRISCLLTRTRTRNAMNNEMVAVSNLHISGKYHVITRGRCGCRLEPLLKKCEAGGRLRHKRGR
ncbi:MAG: hypothetical protein MPJ08_08470 [Nitrosopumilus sp.]|nr:hypothetical protein [Nitrosopumilus sp.]